MPPVEIKPVKREEIAKLEKNRDYSTGVIFDVFDGCLLFWACFCVCEISVPTLEKSVSTVAEVYISESCFLSKFCYSLAFIFKL